MTALQMHCGKYMPYSFKIGVHALIVAHLPPSSSSWLAKMGEIDDFCIKKAWNPRFIQYNLQFYTRSQHFRDALSLY